MTNGQAPTSRPRIVVGVDGSEQSTAALRWAGRLAPALDCDIEAITAWQYVYATALGVSAEWSPAQDAEKILDAAVDEAFPADRPAGLVTRVREGHPSGVLIDASGGAQMLIVGSRGRGGFAAALLGSVSTACAEHGHCPVLVIHEEAAA
jgi:nucleotide-binding universal stress UspA family protein